MHILFYKRDKQDRRRGVVAVQVAVCMVVLLGCAALTIDVGYLYNVRTELQTAADAAALAGVSQLPDEAATRTVAQHFASLNHSGQGIVLAPGDVALGNWDTAQAAFTAGGIPVNAVRVVVRRSEANGNPVELFFARVFGRSQTNLSAEAVALTTTFSSGSARFLIDSELFDTDVPVIEDLADRMGVTPDDLLSDLDGDGFIDMPPGVIELPTGQVGDEGLFEIGPEFPFTTSSSPSLEDFLLFEEGGDQRGILTSDLDPLLGVEPVSDSAAYPSFVSPDQIQVSPVYKGDVSDTEPGVNALGERRGLIAFRILGVGADPDGSGPVLPNLIIVIVPPASVDLGAIDTGEMNGSAQLVQ